MKALAIALALALALPGCSLFRGSSQSPGDSVTTSPSTITTRPIGIVKPTVTPTPPIPEGPVAAVRLVIEPDDARAGYAGHLYLLLATGQATHANAKLRVTYLDDAGKVLRDAILNVTRDGFEPVPGESDDVAFSWNDPYAAFAHTTTMARAQDLLVDADVAIAGGPSYHANATVPATSAVRATLADELRLTVLDSSWENGLLRLALTAQSTSVTPLDLQGYDVSVHAREGSLIVRQGGDAPPAALDPGASAWWNATFDVPALANPDSILLARACCPGPQVLVDYTMPPRPPPGSTPTTNTTTGNTSTNGTARLLEVTTTQGTFTIKLDSADAPLTVAHIVGLARAGFYEGIPFHRYVAAELIQGGDPTCRGLTDYTACGGGGSGQTVPLETSPNATHDYGAVGLARTDDPNSGDSQFYVITATSGAHSFDGRYTIWGKVVDHMDVVLRLRSGDQIQRMVVI